MRTAPSGEVEQWFETLWIHFPSDFGNKGSKHRARAEFQKLHPDYSLFQTMLQGLKEQVLQKRELERNRQFVESFPHVERWIKHRRFEDEISRRIKPKPLDKAGLAAELAFGCDRTSMRDGGYNTFENGASGEIAGSLEDLENGAF